MQIKMDFQLTENERKYLISLFADAVRRGQLMMNVGGDDFEETVEVVLGLKKKIKGLEEHN